MSTPKKQKSCYGQEENKVNDIHNIKRVKNREQERNEISLSTVRNFYSQNEDLFNTAVDAVVMGCVNQYYFNSQEQELIGMVISLEENEIYEVKIKVSDTFAIEEAICQCPLSGLCHHIGALALQSGYEVPIFSYDETTSDDDENLDNKVFHPFHEVTVKCEIYDNFEEPPPTDVKMQGPPLIICSAPRVCKFCNKHFRTKRELSSHQYLDCTTVFSCDVCFCRENTKEALEKHMNVHTPDNEFTCKLCGNLFKSYGVYYYQTDQKAQCNICGKTLKSKGSLRSHAEIHDNRINKCTVCFKNFGRRSHLCRHYRQVHNMEPIKSKRERNKKVIATSE